MSEGSRSSIAAFRSRDFRLYQGARMAVVIGAEAQALAVAWQVYSITHRAIDLGYTGLALFFPGLLFLLPAGHIADRFDRRLVVLVCYSLQALATILLFTFAFNGIAHVWPIYVVLFLIGSGRAFSGPASSALIPQLVPKDDFVNAVTWGATIFQIATITGPTIGGLLFTMHLGTVLVAHAGVQTQGILQGGAIVYLFTLLTLLFYISLISLLSVRPGRQEHKAISADVILAGIRYVFDTPILLGSISLDLFAVLLGGAVALLPIFANEILHAGPRGLGRLRAAPGIGALSVSLWLTVHPIRRRAGVRMLLCVGIFGMATVLFGVSRNLALSMFALLLVGASDMVSVVIRSSILQLATPQEMRGRVSAVNSLFLGASNEFGEFESGLTAQWWGPVRAVVAGGIGSLIVTGLWSRFFPALRQIGSLSQEALLQVTLNESVADVQEQER
jgi:MFS family permease